MAQASGGAINAPSNALDPITIQLPPWVSTAAGYAQAKDEVWGDYQKSTGRNWASRQDFDDAIYFVGWYMDKTATINGVYKYDAYG